MDFLTTEFECDFDCKPAYNLREGQTLMGPNQFVSGGNRKGKYEPMFYFHHVTNHLVPRTRCQSSEWEKVVALSVGTLVSFSLPPPHRPQESALGLAITDPQVLPTLSSFSPMGLAAT